MTARRSLSRNGSNDGRESICQIMKKITRREKEHVQVEMDASKETHTNGETNESV
jgi:hypothetical protein